MSFFDFLSEEPSVEHSRLKDGRHRIIVDDDPPLLLSPVAPNHCRVGCFLATLITAKLSELDGEVPSSLTLTRSDIALAPSLADRYPEIDSGAVDVRIRLDFHPYPEDYDENEDDNDDDADDDDVEMEEDTDEYALPDEEDELPAYIAVLPPEDWTGDFDDWIVVVGRSLGVDVPAPCGPNGYEEAIAEVAKELRRRLPELRRRFLAGMEGQNLGFKIALATESDGKEFVWIRANDWKDESTIVGTLENEPEDCPGFEIGQTLRIPITDLVDFGIGSESGGLIDGGLTQRIAEDFGRIIG